MQEHEMADYERLRADGRWGEATQYREAERRRLRAAGRSKQQARDESWAAMLAKYPPLRAATAEASSPATVTDPNTPKVIIDMTTSPDFETALRWVWSAMAYDPSTIDATQAPQPGCLDLLKFAKSDPKTFFAWVAKYDQKDQQKTDEKKVFEDDQRTHFKLIEKVRQYHRERAQGLTPEQARLAVMKISEPNTPA